MSHPWHPSTQISALVQKQDVAREWGSDATRLLCRVVYQGPSPVTHNSPRPAQAAPPPARKEEPLALISRQQVGLNHKKKEITRCTHAVGAKYESLLPRQRPWAALLGLVEAMIPPEVGSSGWMLLDSW